MRTIALAFREQSRGKRIATRSSSINARTIAPATLHTSSRNIRATWTSSIG